MLATAIDASVRSQREGSRPARSPSLHSRIARQGVNESMWSQSPEELRAAMASSWPIEPPGPADTRAKQRRLCSHRLEQQTTTSARSNRLKRRGILLPGGTPGYPVWSGRTVPSGGICLRVCEHVRHSANENRGNSAPNSPSIVSPAIRCPTTGGTTTIGWRRCHGR